MSRSKRITLWLATVIAAWVGVRWMGYYSTSGNSGELLLAISSFLVAAALLFYILWIRPRAGGDSTRGDQESK